MATLLDFGTYDKMGHERVYLDLGWPIKGAVLSLNMQAKLCQSDDDKSKSHAFVMFTLVSMWYNQGQYPLIFSFINIMYFT